MQFYQDPKQKVLRSYSQALPISRQNRARTGPEYACSFTGLRMTDVAVVN